MPLCHALTGLGKTTALYLSRVRRNPEKKGDKKVTTTEQVEALTAGGRLAVRRSGFSPGFGTARLDPKFTLAAMWSAGSSPR
jgi:hypothetical protein